MGALQAPQQFSGKVVVEVQGARHLEAPKNLHLMVPKSRSIIAQQQWCGGSEAAGGGGAALLIGPPASHTFFASWYGTGVMS